jgi:hypothetical protein
MPVTVRGTDILFNDGTTQNTAGSTVNTTNVLNATAGASAGAVGTYGVTSRGGGTLESGANLGFTAGTWRRMQSSDIYVVASYTAGFGTIHTYLRIS